MWRRAYAVVIVLFASTYLQGCAETAIYYGGKASLERERAPIQIVENDNAIAGCEFLRKVESSTSWGGMLQDDAQKRVISDLTHESVDSGANVLLIRKKSKSVWGSSASGEAYRCPNTRSLPTTTEK